MQCIFGQRAHGVWVGSRLGQFVQDHGQVEIQPRHAGTNIVVKMARQVLARSGLCGGQLPAGLAQQCLLADKTGMQLVQLKFQQALGGTGGGEREITRLARRLK